MENKIFFPLVIIYYLLFSYVLRRYNLIDTSKYPEYVRGGRLCKTWLVAPYVTKSYIND